MPGTPEITGRDAALAAAARAAAARGATGSAAELARHAGLGRSGNVSVARAQPAPA